MTDKHFDIAVVMATYCRPDLLLRCLRNLALQTLPPDSFQVIVVSDGPDEHTKQQVDMFARKHPHLNLHFCMLPVKSGPAAARNAGWQFAQAQLIAFTDDDCIPDPEWLESYLKAAQCSVGDFTFTGSVQVPISHPPTDYEKNISGLATADFITANCCCPKYILAKVGGFDPRFEAAWREDSDLHFKLLKYGAKIHKVTSASVVHPVRSAPWGISLKEQRKSMFNALLFKKHPGHYRRLIRNKPVWRYYVITLSCLLACIAFALDLITIGILFLLIWLSGVFHFTWLRLTGTRKSLSHVTEMFVTSIIIPFTSIFWTLYGSIKYKVFFL